MARHATITAIGWLVYFTHPYSLLKRGSKENLNRIVRKFFPRGVTIAADPNYSAIVASEMNVQQNTQNKKALRVVVELIETHISTG